MSTKTKIQMEVHALVSRIYEVEADELEKMPVKITMKGIWSMKMRITKTLIRFA